MLLAEDAFIYNELTAKDWLQRIARGDELAFELLYKHTAAGIYQAVLTYVKAEYVAEEIVQDVYIQLWNNRQKLAGVEKADGYLFMMARNAVMTHFRKITAEQRLFIALKETTPRLGETASGQVITKEYQAIHTRAMDLLPAQQQAAYRLAYEQELSLPDIATQMGLSRSTVKKHLELSRRFVRDYVNAHIHYHVMLCALLSAIFLFPH